MDFGAETNTSDRIALTIPPGDGYRTVATLVLGGVGTRLELPYERVDDLQLAVLSLLDAAGGGESSLEIEIEGSHVLVTVGPVADGSGSDEALQRVLSRLADEVSTTQRDDGEWVALRLERP